MRHYGLVVSDDPTDYDRTFGVSGDDFVIPFEISGTTVFFSSTGTNSLGIGKLSLGRNDNGLTMEPIGGIHSQRDNRQY